MFLVSQSDVSGISYRRGIFYFCLSLLLIYPSFAYPQSYTDYQASNNFNELSFEAMFIYYAKELGSTQKFLEAELEAELNSNIITEAVINYRLVKNQIKYLEKNKFPVEELRICGADLESLNTNQKDKYLKIHEVLERKYSISPTEYKIVKATIAHLRNKTKNAKLIQDVNLYEQYFELAYELKYSKLEIFRDFTGYWEPTDILNYKSMRELFAAFWSWKNFERLYRDPLNFASKSDQHGLKAKEAIRRLKDLRECKEQIDFTR